MQADGDLRSRAQRFLWPHFTRAAAWRDDRLPVLVRGEGCHVFDDSGTRYLDGLAGLFCVALGHGRADLVSAATAQMQQLAYATNWGTANPSAIEAAQRIAESAPGDLSMTFFVNSGSEAVESAIKFCRQYHRSQGHPDRTVIISRSLAYHGTTLGALRSPACRACRSHSCRCSGTSGTSRTPWDTPAIVGRPASLTVSRRSRPPSSRKGRNGWPRCSRSRCRTPACACPTGRLLDRAAPDLRHLRRAAGRRRGDLRLRQAGLLVRQPEVRRRP